MKKLAAVSLIALTLACKSTAPADGETKEGPLENGINALGNAMAAPYRLLTKNDTRKLLFKYDPGAKNLPKEELAGYVKKFEGVSRDGFEYIFRSRGTIDTAYDFDGDGVKDTLSIVSNKSDKGATIFDRENKIRISYSSGKPQFDYTEIGPEIKNVKPWSYVVTTPNPGLPPVETKTVVTTDFEIMRCEYMNSNGKERCIASFFKAP